MGSPPGSLLRTARQRSGLSQRDVASRAGVPPSTVARIETGRIIPRADTLDRVLRATGHTLAAIPVPGTGTDLSQIHRLLMLSPAERLRQVTQAARSLQRLRRSARKVD